MKKYYNLASMAEASYALFHKVEGGIHNEKIFKMHSRIKKTSMANSPPPKLLILFQDGVLLPIPPI